MESSATPTVAGAAVRPIVSGNRRRTFPLVRELVRNKRFTGSLLLLIPIVLLALFAPILPLPAPLETSVKESFTSPGWEHPFGTDKLGRDILSRTLAGLKTSFAVGFSVAALAIAGGMLVGTVSGFYGGRIDRMLMAVVDMFLAFPSLLLAIGLVAIIGAGTIPVIVAITMADLPRMIRLQRSMVLSLKSRPFMDAARMVSAPGRWLMWKHIVPNTVAAMLVAASITAANAILTEASLSFLGLGITPPAPSLGNIIHDGQMYLQKAWWISTMPGIVILLIAVSLHLMSDGIRQVLDPKARK
jgi:peptide/nickel transport system permease protein